MGFFTILSIISLLPWIFFLIDLQEDSTVAFQNEA